MRAYKLLKVRKNGSLGPLFINRKQILPTDQWLQAEEHKTKGYKFRPGWHATKKPIAPHLSMKDRTWYEVELEDYEEFRRPESQGGLWFVAQRMRIIRKV